MLFKKLEFLLAGTEFRTQSNICEEFILQNYLPAFSH